MKSDLEDEPMHLVYYETALLCFVLIRSLRVKTQSLPARHECCGGASNLFCLQPVCMQRGCPSGLQEQFWRRRPADEEECCGDGQPNASRGWVSSLGGNSVSVQVPYVQHAQETSGGGCEAADLNVSTQTSIWSLCWRWSQTSANEIVLSFRPKNFYISLYIFSYNIYIFICFTLNILKKTTK